MNTNLHKNQYWSSNICARKLNSLHNYLLFCVVYLKCLIISELAHVTSYIVARGAEEN